MGLHQQAAFHGTTYVSYFSFVCYRVIMLTMPWQLAELPGIRFENAPSRIARQGLASHADLVHREFTNVHSLGMLKFRLPEIVGADSLRT